MLEVIFPEEVVASNVLVKIVPVMLMLPAPVVVSVTLFAELVVKVVIFPTVMLPDALTIKLPKGAILLPRLFVIFTEEPYKERAGLLLPRPVMMPPMVMAPREVKVLPAVSPAVYIVTPDGTERFPVPVILMEVT